MEVDRFIRAYVAGNPSFAVGFEQWVEKRRAELAAAAMEEIA